MLFSIGRFGIDLQKLCLDLLTLWQAHRAFCRRPEWPLCGGGANPIFFQRTRQQPRSGTLSARRFQASCNVLEAHALQFLYHTTLTSQICNMNYIATQPGTQTSRSHYGRLAEWFKASDLGELKHLKLKFSDIFGCKGSNPLSLINFFLIFKIP